MRRPMRKRNARTLGPGERVGSAVIGWMLTEGVE